LQKREYVFIIVHLFILILHDFSTPLARLILGIAGRGYFLNWVIGLLESYYFCPL